MYFDSYGVMTNNNKDCFKFCHRFFIIWLLGSFLWGVTTSIEIMHQMLGNNYLFELLSVKYCVFPTANCFPHTPSSLWGLKHKTTFQSLTLSLGSFLTLQQVNGEFYWSLPALGPSLGLSKLHLNTLAKYILLLQIPMNWKDTAVPGSYKCYFHLQLYRMTFAITYTCV